MMVEDAEISGWVSGRRSEASDLSLQRGSSHPYILSWEEQIFSSLTTMTDWKNGSLSVFHSSRPLISSEWAEKIQKTSTKSNYGGFLWAGFALIAGGIMALDFFL